MMLALHLTFHWFLREEGNSKDDRTARVAFT